MTGLTLVATQPGEFTALVERVERATPGLYERFLKRPLDLALAIGALIVLSPLIAGAAIAAYLSVGRPVLFRQTRIGRDGKPFEVLKFRSMLPDRRVADLPFAGPDRRKVHKTPHDPRITRVGRLLRRSSLDELPQLINVIRGEMSVVGPRPELAGIVADYAPWQHLRHRVKPGITGLWQITERDGDELMHERTEIDLDYVDTLSFRNDVAIVAATIPSVLTRSLRTGSGPAASRSGATPSAGKTQGTSTS